MGEPGLYRKYRVERLDGTHEHCDYFVLDLTHDSAARRAAITYAHIVAATNPELANDLILAATARND